MNAIKNSNTDDKGNKKDRLTLKLFKKASKWKKRNDNMYGILNSGEAKNIFNLNHDYEKLTF